MPSPSRDMGEGGGEEWKYSIKTFKNKKFEFAFNLEFFICKKNFVKILTNLKQTTEGIVLRRSKGRLGTSATSEMFWTKASRSFSLNIPLRKRWPRSVNQCSELHSVLNEII